MLDNNRNFSVLGPENNFKLQTTSSFQQPFAINSRPCWCDQSRPGHMLKFVSSSRLNNNQSKMDNSKSSNPNSTSSSPRANRAKSEDKTDVISSDDSITVVEINRDDSVKVSNDNKNDNGNEKECNISNDDGRNGHDNKAFIHTEETTSGSSSGSSTSSPEPPVNFELRDMSPNTHPKIISSNSMEKVPIDALDGMTAKEKEGRFGDDYLISINEHQKTGLK